MLPRPFRQSAGQAGATHALGFGLLLTFSSSIGQTYFIALFAGALRADLGLSHGAFGGLYTLATLASALTLVWLGKTADRFDPAVLAALTLAALAGSALLLAGAESVLWLGYRAVRSAPIRARHVESSGDDLCGPVVCP